MTRERFSEIFTGHALVISNPNVNGTMNQTNQSAEDTESGELEKLTAEEIQSIIGKCGGLSIAAIVAIKGVVKKIAIIRHAKAIWKLSRMHGESKQGAAMDVAIFLFRKVDQVIEQRIGRRVWNAMVLGGLALGEYMHNTPPCRRCVWAAGSRVGFAVAGSLLTK